MSDLALNIVASYKNSGALSSVTSDLNKVEKATKTASQSIKDFGKGMSTIGAGLTAGVTLPLVGLGIAAIKAGNELNAGLANIQSLGVASARVKELKANVQDMQMQFGKSAKELTDGLYQITSAFGDTKDSAKELEIAVKTGVAGVSTTTEAINLLSAVTKAWGDTSVAAQTHVADLALKTVELGQTTLPELAGSLGDVTASTNALGIKQEEMFSIYSSTTGVLGNTAKVTIGYKGILQSLMTPTESMSKLFKGLGVSSGAAMIQHFGLEGSILRVVAAQKKSGESLQAFIPMADGQSEAMLLAGTVAQKYTSDLQAMNKASGKMEDAYKSQVDGPNAAGVAMDRATQKIQVMLERIHDGLGPAMLAFANLIDPVVNKLLDLTDVFSKLDPSTQTWIVGLVGVAAAIGPIMFGMGKFIQIAGVAMPVIGGLASGLALLAIPLGLLAVAYRFNVLGMRTFVDVGLKRIQAAAPLAGDAIKGLWHNLTNVKDKAGQSAYAISDFVTALTGSQATGNKFSDFIHDLGWKIEGVKVAFEKAGGGAAGFVAGFQKLTGVDLVAKLGGVKTVIADLFSGNIDTGALVAKLSAALSSIPGMLTTLFSSTDFSGLKTQITSALGIENLSFDFSKISATVSAAVSKELSTIDWSTITADFKSLPIWVSQKLSIIDWSTITTNFLGLLSQVNTKLYAIDWSVITITFSNLVTQVNAKLSAIDWSTIAADFKNLPLWVSQKLSLVDWSTITTTFSKFTSWVSAKLDALDWSGVTTTFDTLKTQVKTLLDGIDFSSVTTTFDGLTKTVTGFDASIKGATGTDGGLTKLQAMFIGGLKTISDTLNGIDQNKVASAGLSFSGTISSVLNALTTLSNLGNDTVGKATGAISDIVKTILNLATSFTTGLDATKISESAGKFVASYVDELTKVLGNADLPGIAKSASGLIKAITGQFDIAMKGDAPTEIGKSLGGLVTTMVTQLGAVLNDKALAANLGQSFANIVAGITEGLGNALKGFNSADATKDVNIQGAIGEFINNFLTGIGAGLEKADYAKVFSGFISGFTKSISGMKQLMDDIEADSKIPSGFSADGINSRLKILKDIMNLGAEDLHGTPLKAPVSGGGFGGPGDKPITTSSVTVNAGKVDVAGAGGTNLLTGAGGADKTLPIIKPDFSALLNDLKTFKPVITVEPIKVEKVPDVKVEPLKVEPIPPVAAPVILPPTIPPITVAQPTWLGSLLSWLPPNFGFLGGNTTPVTGAHATGTNSTMSGMALVGEQGPEVAIFPGGTRILSNPNSKAFLGGMQSFATGTAGFTTLPALNMPATANDRYVGTWDAILFNMKVTADSTQKVAALTQDVKTQTKRTADVIAVPGGHPALHPANNPAGFKTMNPLLMPKMPGKQTYEDMQKIGMDIAKAFKGTIQEFKGFLEKVPGLFSASSVTADDMAAAKKGSYVPKADEKLRQLKDLSEHGVSYAGLNVQDFKDALGRIGIKASDDLKTLTAQVTSAWNDQSLFSDKKNISSLIDINAVKASVTQQQVQAKQQAAGNANLLALFGLQPEAVKGQAQAFGSQFRTDALAGFTGTGTTGTGATGKGAAPDFGSILLGGASITPESVAPLAASFLGAFVKALAPQKDKNGKATGIDFGAKFADSINESLKTSTALDSSGQIIFQKIADSGKDTKVDFMAGIVSAMNTNVGTESSIKALNNVGQKIGEILKQGIGDFFKTTDLAAAVGGGVKPGATGASPIPTAHAIGTNSSPGGYVRVGDTGPEMLWIPPRSGVYPQRDGAGGGNTTHVTVNASVANGVDVRSLAYQVADILQRKAR